MTTPQIVIGKRGAAYGIWATPAGIDALTATDAQCSLNMSDFVSQLIMRGSVTGLPKTVALGLPVAPVVMITTLSTFNGLTGMIRPYPNTKLYATKNCTATVTGTDMVISGGATSVNYLVFRKGTV